jgi:hypothetical protein
MTPEPGYWRRDDVVDDRGIVVQISAGEIYPLPKFQTGCGPQTASYGISIWGYIHASKAAAVLS